MTLEEMQKKESELWKQIQAHKAAIAPVEMEWLMLRHAIAREKVREDIRQEVEAKLAKETEAA